MKDSTKSHEIQYNSTLNSNTEFDWSNLLAAIIGGLIGLIPSIYSALRSSRIKGKIINQYGNVGATPGHAQQSNIYLQKMSVFSGHKTFSLAEIKVFIKFPNRQEIECMLWTWRHLTFTFQENNANVIKQLKISSNKYLLHYTLFPKNESIVGYISFTHSPVVNDPLEYIRYVFIDFNGRRKELIIEAAEIRGNALAHDDSIWI